MDIHRQKRTKKGLRPLNLMSQGELLELLTDEEKQRIGRYVRKNFKGQPGSIEYNWEVEKLTVDQARKKYWQIRNQEERHDTHRSEGDPDGPGTPGNREVVPGEAAETAEGRTGESTIGEDLLY